MTLLLLSIFFSRIYIHYHAFIKFVEHCIELMYADDTQVYKSSTSVKFSLRSMTMLIDCLMVLQTISLLQILKRRGIQNSEKMHDSIKK